MRFRQQKKEKTFTFHWRGGYLTREVLGELLEQISAAGRERGKKRQSQCELAAGGAPVRLCGGGQCAGGECCDGRSK